MSVQKLGSIFSMSFGFALVALGCVTLAHAQNGMSSNAVIHRAGLTVEWFTQSGIGHGGEIVDWTMTVNENKSTTYFILEAGKFREVISQNSLNAFGEPYGLDGGVAQVELRKEILEAELKADGNTDIKPTIDQYTLPQTSIYILTDEGVVTSIDGDSGKANWTTEVGNSYLPSIGLGANHDHVVVTNGTTVYLLDANNGKELLAEKCTSAIGASPAVSDDRIFVPLLDGRLETFSIEINESRGGREKFSFVARGAGSARPVVTEHTVAWPTSSGDLNVAARFGLRNQSLSYRLLTDRAIVSSPTFQSGVFYVGSLDGYVYSIDEQRGSTKWEVSTGEGVSQSPVPFGDSIYVATDDGLLFRIHAETGRYMWEEPVKNIGKFIGVSKNRLYLTDEVGQLIGLNPESGAILSRVPVGNIKYILPNQATDRLYFASESGIIQCLREVASKSPYFHSEEIASRATPAGKAAMTADPEKAAMAEGGAEIDPFAPKSKEADPFATKPVEEDPFAPKADGAAAESDPFAPKADDKSAAEDDPFK